MSSPAVSLPLGAPDPRELPVPPMNRSLTVAARLCQMRLMNHSVTTAVRLFQMLPSRDRQGVVISYGDECSVGEGLGTVAAAGSSHFHDEQTDAGGHY